MYTPEYNFHKWMRVSSRAAKEATLKEVRLEVANKPWLWSLLPEWLKLFTSSPEYQPQASNPFSGSRLASGGPRSLQKVSRRRKARIPAGAPAAMVPAPVPAPAAMVPAPAAMVPAPVPAQQPWFRPQLRFQQPWFRAPVPSHTAMVPCSGSVPSSHGPCSRTGPYGHGSGPSSVPSSHGSDSSAGPSSHVPTQVPTQVPSLVTSRVFSRVPSQVPSRVSSRVPSRVPSQVSSRVPSRVPSQVPSPVPSRVSSRVPSQVTSQVSSRVPSQKELKKKWDSLRTQYTRYTRYRRLAPSGSSGTLKTGRQQWILTRVQFLEPYTRRKESTSNLTITEPPVAAESPSDGTSSETLTSTPEEPFLFDAESMLRTPLAESTICGTESTPAPLGEGPSTLT
ncbi:hypothetical protein F7725_000151 [Dissostichus mawsoni]|uniref:MADF domain-containing protein n=1 Tax=Dissostichus mawsoni TaxID=36200 RepID=A0A7J5ZE49_DISMA|nr:hypothetical protein F7725_000151 [Dissostichus mawsoni]